MGFVRRFAEGRFMQMSALRRRTTRIRAWCAGAPMLEAGRSPAALRVRQQFPAPQPRGHPAPRPSWVLVAAVLHLLTLGCVPVLIAGGLSGQSSSSANPVGALLVADGSVCAKALVAALSKIGSAYVLGTKGPTTFDCSGLTRWSYGVAGVQLGWDSYAQITEGQRTDCTYADFHGTTTTCWKPGDLIFLQYPETGAPGGIGQHVALYDRDGYIVGCENLSVGCIRQLPERNSFYKQYFAMGRRIADCPLIQPTPVPAVASR